MSFRVTHRVIGPALIALALAAAAPSWGATFAFTGTTTNDTPPPMPSPLCSAGMVRVAFSSANAAVTGASNFGGFSPSLGHCLTLPPSSYSGGVFDFTFDAGDVLSGTYSGFFTPTATPGILNSTVDYVVTGGTGRFVGATGGFKGVGTLDRTVPRPFNSLTLTGSLSLPAVPEPATWGLMILGFGLAGGSLRRRRALAA
jgi:hypothetical protein